MPGIILAAPASGAGKTTIALGMMRALSRAGKSVAPAKVGPDYIDPAFHTRAAGRISVNLDPWAMRADTIRCLAQRLATDSDIALVEGVMGLFDGAADGTGSTADLARALGWPVILIVDTQGQAASAAAVVRGFASHRPDVQIKGVLFNRVGSAAHSVMLREAMKQSGMDIPVLGCLPREQTLSLPSRHLGLVQAGETQDLETRLTRMADWVEAAIDLSALCQLGAPFDICQELCQSLPFPPLGQKIAVASDVAFAFAYPHLLSGWRAAGAEILTFSPLADEAPPADADAVFLPGGYPELHAAQLASNQAFLNGVREAAHRGAAVYGECGGYMSLGKILIDAQGMGHAMAGLLPIETSFATPKLHLGYRTATLLAETPFGIAGTALSGHEFHYAQQVRNDCPDPLFAVTDARGAPLATAGARVGRVAGSFLHLIDSRV